MSDLNEILADVEDFFSKKNVEIQMIGNQVKIYHHNYNYILLIIGENIEAHLIDGNNAETKLIFTEIEGFFKSYENLFFRSHLREE
tara:strand:- start:822 stop:1079 length:258 start_codon:yes stop_codon:yes gene_type:complete